MIFLLLASLFLADGPLEASGWTLRQACDRDCMYVQDGVLHCEFSPGPAANSGIVYGIDVPYYERGEVSYEIMPRATSSGSTTDYYMPIRIGNLYFFLHNKGMQRICDDMDPRYFQIGDNMFEPAKWVKVKVVWDNVRRRVKYYVGDMTRPNKIEYDYTVEAGIGQTEQGKMQVRIYNYARAQVTETHLIRDFEVREYVPPPESESVPRTKALVFRGLTSAFFPLEEWTKDFAAEDVVKFNLDYPGSCITTKNANSMSALPDEDVVKAAKLIVLCDIPFKTKVLPYPVQEDILDAVRAGARLVVTAGYAGLERGEGYDSPIVRELPVTFVNPWTMPVPKNGKAVRYYGKGEISVVLRRMMLEDEEWVAGANVESEATKRGLVSEWQVFDGTGDWPTSGNVIVSAPVSVDSAERAAAVAGWEQAYLDKGVALAFADLDEPLEFMANLKGAGAVIATNCAKIVMSGDSREYAGTADWTFTDADLHIGGEYALGPKDSHRVVMTYAATQIAAGLHLTIGWEGQPPGEDGIKAYTNHVPIVWENTSFARVGSSAADERFVQDADMLVAVSGNADITLFGRYEQTSGTFGRILGQKAWLLYLRNGKCYGEGPVYSSYGDSAIVTFSGSTRISAGNPDAVNGSNPMYVFGPEVHFAHAGGIATDSLCVDVGALVFDRDNAMVAVPEGSHAPSLRPYLMNTGVYRNRFDLNGHDTTLGYLSTVHQVDETTATYYYVTSAIPATLTLAGAEAGKTVVAPVEFRGAVSLSVGNGCTNWFARRATVTTGGLAITNGVLGFKWGASWKGDSLAVAAAGVLDLEAGTSLSVKTATVDGIDLYRGVYTIAELCERFPGRFAGDAAATVSVTDGWQPLDGTTAQWPTDGRVKVFGEVVVSNAEQSAAVAGWTQLWLTDSSKLVVSNNAAETTVAADLIGSGRIAAIGSAKVAFAGDSREYAGTGDWTFENTPLHIGGEWALGPKSDTHRVVLRHRIGSDLTDQLTIGWEGQSSFTNHTHIAWQAMGDKVGNVNSLDPVIGPSAADQWFVQDGDMIYLSNYAPRFMFQGQYEQLSGRIGRCFQKAWPIYFYNKSGRGDYKGSPARVRFTGTGRIVCGSEASAAEYNVVWCYAIAMEFAGTLGNHVGSINYDCNVLRLLADNVMEDSVAGAGLSPLVPTLLNQTKYRNELDLNGHDVRFGGLHRIYSTVPSETSTFYTKIHSDDAATITLTDPKDPTVSFITAAEVSGAVSIVVDNGCTNELVTKVSPSSGTVTVRRGSVLRFKWGGGWTGPAVVDGGVLDAADSSALGSNTTLAVTGGGVLNLQTGVALSVRSVTLGGVALRSGVYTVAQLKAAYPGRVTGDDAATLAVSVTADAPVSPFADRGVLALLPEEGENYELVPVDADQDAVEIGELGAARVTIPLQVRRTKPFAASTNGQIAVRSGLYDITPALQWLAEGEYATYALKPDATVKVEVGGVEIDVPVTPALAGDDFITQPFAVDGAAAVVSLETIPGLYYTLMRGAEPGKIGTKVGPSVQAVGGPLALADEDKPTGRAFYRIAVTLDAKE